MRSIFVFALIALANASAHAKSCNDELAGRHDGYGDKQTLWNPDSSWLLASMALKNTVKYSVSFSDRIGHVVDVSNGVVTMESLGRLDKFPIGPSIYGDFRVRRSENPTEAKARLERRLKLLTPEQLLNYANAQEAMKSKAVVVVRTVHGFEETIYVGRIKAVDIYADTQSQYRPGHPEDFGFALETERIQRMHRGQDGKVQSVEHSEPSAMYGLSLGAYGMHTHQEFQFDDSDLISVQKMPRLIPGVKY